MRLLNRLQVGIWKALAFQVNFQAESIAHRQAFDAVRAKERAESDCSWLPQFLYHFKQVLSGRSCTLWRNFSMCQNFGLGVQPIQSFSEFAYGHAFSLPHQGPKASPRCYSSAARNGECS